jgi:hypothetical protein
VLTSLSASCFLGFSLLFLRFTSSFNSIPSRRRADTVFLHHGPIQLLNALLAQDSDYRRTRRQGGHRSWARSHDIIFQRELKCEHSTKGKIALEQLKKDHTSRLRILRLFGFAKSAGHNKWISPPVSLGVPSGSHLLISYDRFSLENAECPRGSANVVGHDFRTERTFET